MQIVGTKRSDACEPTGGLGSLASLVAACFAPTYSAIFDAVGSGGDCSNGDDEYGSVDDRWVWTPFALSAFMAVISLSILIYWANRFPASADDPLTVKNKLDSNSEMARQDSDKATSGNEAAGQTEQEGVRA